MIEFLPETSGNLLAIKLSGTITEQDYDKLLSQADDIFDRERIEHLVLDWEQLKGWAPGARSVGTWFGMHYRASIGRVAIIADKKWAGEVSRVIDIHRAADVRQFAPDNRAKAYAWVRQD
jgi:hypothetical protein